jgi:dolichol-phosphate mannosyltransferase
VGSRYVEGGKIEKWNRLRRLLSRLGNFYARHLLGSLIMDMTSGFVLWKREVLEKVDPSCMRSNGYVCNIELKYRAFQYGFSHQEAPITFTERELERSKIDLGIILEAFWKVLALAISKVD